MKTWTKSSIPLSMLLQAIWIAGCVGEKNAAVTEQFFTVPGEYPHTPCVYKPRVGVLMPDVEVTGGVATPAQAQDAAADEIFWLADRMGRFNLIDRVRLAEIAAQQGVSLPTGSGDSIHVQPLRGIDFILVCKVSELNVRGDDKHADVSVAHVGEMLHLSESKPRINTKCIVNLHLIDPATGLFAARTENAFKRSCSPEAMGLKFDNPESVWGELRLDQKQIGQVLRIVLDDAVRKMLPDVDAMLVRREKLGSTTPTATGAIASDPAGGRPATSPIIPIPRPPPAKVFCKECGFEATSEDQFCPNCAARLSPANRAGTRIAPGGSH